MFISLVTAFLQGYSSECVSALTLIFCYLSIIVALRYWREAGLYVYSAIAIIACNLQVLTAAVFTSYREPVVLGTVIYATIFLVNDILTERFGSVVAKKCVVLSTTATVLLLVFMMLTLSYKPLVASSEDLASFIQARQAIEVLFKPNLAILLASQIAYMFSQWCDITIFASLRKLSQHHLWFRSFLSVALGAMIDTLIFNVLAWQVFADSPLSFESLFYNYIVGSYVIQLLIALCNIPVFYFILALERMESKTDEQ